jgi:hypothetical protein
MLNAQHGEPAFGVETISFLMRHTTGAAGAFRNQGNKWP